MSERITLKSAPSKPPNSSRGGGGGPLLRIARLLVFVAAVTGLAIWGAVWWEERPLAAIAEDIEQKDYKSALESADSFLEEHPDDIRAGILKARALSGLNRHRQADALFERIALRADGFPDDDAALRAWAFSLLHLQRWTGAIAKFENLLKSHPSDPELHYSLTAAQIRAKQYRQALVTARRLRSIPGYADKADVMIGTIHHDLGNRRLALKAWERVLARNPEGVDLQIPAEEFLANVGGEMLVLGRPQQAVAVLERSVTKRPTAAGLATLGKACADTGRLPKAVDAWKRAVQRDQFNAVARDELANVALRRGRPREALDWLLPLTTTGNLDGSTAYLLQRAYTQLKQPDSAAEWKDRAAKLRRAENIRSTLHELLRRSTDPFWIGVVRAYQLAEQKRWDEAVPLLKELRKQQPRNSLLRDLAQAVRNRGPLPELSRLTGKQY